MPIVSGDMKTYKTTNGLGGAITATESVSGNPGNVFDTFTGSETAAGGTFYHCIYVKNTHGTLTAQSVGVYVDSETSHAGVNVEIGLGTSAVNGTEQTVANETTAPAGVTFADADGVGNALSIGDIPPGEHKAIWVKVTIGASTTAKTGYAVNTKYVFDTAE